MRINKILENSRSNGPGRRFTIWTQGCYFHCHNCINQNTWDFNGGEERKIEDIVEQIKATQNVEGITLTGGEPLHQYRDTLELAKLLFKDYNIFLTTGYDFLVLKASYKAEILKYVDILVSGPYVDSLYTNKMLWRGSTNQELHYLTERGKQTFEKLKNEIVKAEIIIDKTSDTILTTGFSIPEQLIR